MKTHQVYSISKPTTPPHIRHTATVNRVVTPEGYNSEVAITVCGRALRHFWIVDDVGDLDTEGHSYLTPCPLCHKD